MTSTQGSIRTWAREEPDTVVRRRNRSKDQGFGAYNLILVILGLNATGSSKLAELNVGRTAKQAKR